MQNRPHIQTAIPQRRYQYANFGVTVLGEIASVDGRDYTWIMAFVEDGQAQPTTYLISEHCPPGERGEGSHRLRVMNASMDEIVSTDGAWSRLEHFCEQALAFGGQLLGLDKETPYRLG